MSSLKYRKERIKKIIKYWKFRKCHDLMASFKPSKREFEAFKNYVKIYISKSLGIDYFENDAKFLKSLEKFNKIEYETTGYLTMLTRNEQFKKRLFTFN